MATISVDVFTGIWTDWPKGPIIGSTLTLKDRDGVLLLAFVAAFVAIASARLWLIVRFVAHQLLVSERIHDGLYFQRQSILRNVGSPVGTAWRSLQQWWYWREGFGARKLARRTLPTAALALAYAAVFIIVAVFSARVSDSRTEGSFRLVRSSRDDLCGIVDINRSQISPSTDTTSIEDVPFGEKEGPLRANHAWNRERNEEADSYARECYETAGGEAGDDHDSDELRGCCKVLASPFLPWRQSSISCPFGDLCINGSAIRLETDLLDSRTHLGINEPQGNRLQFKRRTECAPIEPLVSENDRIPFRTVDTGEIISNCFDLSFLYGPVVRVNDSMTVANETHLVFTCNDAEKGISQFTTRLAYAGGTIRCPVCENGQLAWKPIAGLEPTDREVTVIFIVANGVRHTAPNTDPIFGTGPVDDKVLSGTASTVYHPGHPVGVLACSDALQVCNPNASGEGGRCTPITSALDLFSGMLSGSLSRDLGLNGAQSAAAFVGLLTSLETSIYQITVTRPASFLDAQRTVSERRAELRNDQWEVESRRLFEASLARLQHGVLIFAGGTDLHVPRGIVVTQPWRDERWVGGRAKGTREEEAGFEGVAAAAGDLPRLCRTQRVRAAEGTLSFSVLGLGLIFGAGGLVILASVVVEPLTEFVQRRTGKGSAMAAAWRRDESLQVQRLLFEERGQGEWLGANTSVPRTRYRTSLWFPVEEDGASDGRGLVARNRQSLSGRHAEEMYMFNQT